MSVVVAAYNAERFLAATIQSVLDQDVSDWELVIVDDGSTDGTTTTARRFSEQDDRVELVRQTNHGLSAARNAGFARTSQQSGAVMFLDADDLLEPGALGVLLRGLTARPTCAGVYGLARFIDAHGRPFRVGEAEARGRNRKALVGAQPVPWPAGLPTTFAVLALGNCIHTPGQVLLRRETFESAGGFDLALVSAEDWDLWLRITARGSLALLDRVVIGYRRHGRNLSSDRQRVLHAFRAVRRKLAESRALCREQRELVQLGGQWAALDDGRQYYVSASPARSAP